MTTAPPIRSNIDISTATSDIIALRLFIHAWQQYHFGRRTRPSLLDESERVDPGQAATAFDQDHGLLRQFRQRIEQLGDRHDICDPASLKFMATGSSSSITISARLSPP